MRVLSVINYPTFGGPHNRTLRLVPALARKGIQTTVLLPEEGDTARCRFLAGGVEVTTQHLHRPRATLKPWPHLGFLSGWIPEVNSIRRLIRERNIDLVQVNGLLQAQGAVAAKLEKRALVWMVIDSAPPKALRAAMAPVVRHMADAIMVSGKRIATEHPGLERDDDECLVAYFPPVDTELFRASPVIRAKARNELELEPEDIVIGAIGNVYAAKDYITFVRAAGLVKARRPKARFIILGSLYKQYEEYTRLLWREAQAAGLRRDDDVRILNAQGRVAELAQAFDIYWMTSITEGAPNALEEAMSLGLPCIVTDVGAVREMVDDGLNAQVVPAGDSHAFVDATLSLIDSEQRRVELSREARKAASQRFNVEVCADAHERAFAIAMRAAGLPYGRS